MHPPRLPDAAVTTQLTSTSEWPTFFGPDASPLFGVLHMPADQRIRGGVIICASLGKEGMDSVRFQRILADDLAAAGFAVLRFDYLGSGDSAYRQFRDDAVGHWVESVQHAVAHLESIGAKSVSAIAIRAGGLILNSALPHLPAVDRAIYIDPVFSGRRYVREQAALFRLSVGPDDVPDGTVSMIGGILSDKAAKALSALALEPASIETLLLVRPGEEARLQAFNQSEQVDVEAVLGLPEFARAADILVPMPLEALSRAVAWLDDSVKADRTVANARSVTSVTMPSDSSGASEPIVETIETIGGTDLFAIRSRPANSMPGEGKVVVFFTTSNDPHVGPAREWVELSRQLAGAGAQAVRWDRSGIGDSGPIVREQWQPIYSKKRIQEGLMAVRHAAPDLKDVSVVGICSGSWYAAHAARALRLDSAILVNPGIWNWRLVSRLAWQWNVHRELRWAAERSTPGSAPDGQDNRKPSLRQRVVEYLKPHRDRLKAVVRANVPRSAMRVLGRTGMSQAPEVMLEPLAREGTSTTVILSPTDAELFGDVGGYQTAEELVEANLPLRVRHVPFGDHAAYHQSVLITIREQVLLEVEEGRSAVDAAHADGGPGLNGFAGGGSLPIGRIAPTPVSTPSDDPTDRAWSAHESPPSDPS
jgi:pimeloyl-ACP methyl ester carboxylesterase